MKKLSHLFLCFLLLAVVFSCSKTKDPVEPDPEDPSVPSISNLSIHPEVPQPDEDVVVSATITTPESAELSSVVLKWAVDGVNQPNVTMSNGGSGDVYSATIPGQNGGEDEVDVNFTVVATNKNGDAEKQGSYTVSIEPLDFSKLALNEINGTGVDTEKYIELYNNSLRTIPLRGVTITYDNLDGPPRVTWTGEDQVIPPKSFLLLQGSKGSGDLETGLSASSTIIVEMFDSDGNRIDIFNIDAETTNYNSYSRMPDGTGKWYLTNADGTPGVTNGTSATGLTPIPLKPIITDLTRNIDIPKMTDEVTVSATVKTFSGTTLTSVVLKWKHDGISQSDIATTNVGDVYSATIPAQAANSLVEYTISATNDEDETCFLSDSYYVWKDGMDYSKLKLNEVSGVGDDCEKFYELINTGTEDILLAGCKIYYNANGSTNGVFPPNGNQGLTWTGGAMQLIKAGKLFCLIGRNGGDCANPPTPCSFTTGLTAARILIITLEDPAGNTIDQCIRSEDTGIYAITDQSFSRIPDGSGPFYFTTPTPDATNGTSTAGLTLVPETQVTIPDADYTHLILNEISGNNKYVEIYNSGTEAIPLTGVKLQRNDGPSTGGSEWTGTSADVIPAGAYRLFLFNSYTSGLDTNPAYVGWTVSSGISSGQVLKVALVAPSGKPISVFIRGDVPLPAWQSTAGVTQNSTDTYSRMSDDSWAYAAPTPGAANDPKTDDIVSPGYLIAQP